MTLPLLIHRGSRVPVGVFWGLLFASAYLLPNHFHLFEPRLLPLTWVDRVTPFAPWTITVYVSEYVMFVLAYFLLGSDYNRDRYMWAFFGATLLSDAVFVFFPTTFPRSGYPLPEGLPWLVDGMFSLLRSVDTPANAFPSMHVCCCYLTAFSFLPREEARWKFLLFSGWSTVVAASTLTTKQHYLVDILAGFAQAAAVHWIFFRRTRYVPLGELTRRLFRKDPDARCWRSARRRTGS